MVNMKFYTIFKLYHLVSKLFGDLCEKEKIYELKILAAIYGFLISFLIIFHNQNFHISMIMVKWNGIYLWMIRYYTFVLSLCNFQNREHEIYRLM